MNTTMPKVDSIAESIRNVKHREMTAVYIGRFSLPHDGHFNTIRLALQNFKNLVIFVGSANKRRSEKNPFTFQERKKLLLDGLAPSEQGKVTVLPLCDRRTLAEWIAEVDGRLSQLTDDYRRSNYRVLGHDKDNSSYYLHRFGQMKFVETGDYKGLNASDLRASYFRDGVISPMVPPHVENFLKIFKTTETYNDLAIEWNYYHVKEPEQFEDYPYPKTIGFMCADALVTCGPNVLLIKRDSETGNGCWALPGGFLDKDVTFFEGALRELKQETKIKVPDEILPRCVVDPNGKIYDDPGRSNGIRRVTRAFRFDVLPDDKGFPPKVRPASDAKEAWWFNLSEIREMLLYDDHKEIIEDLLGMTLTPSWLTY